MNIIVTGASKGIGYATCLELSRNSKYQITALSRNLKLLEKLRDECLEKYGNEIKILPFDLQNPNWELLTRAINEMGHVDVLLNNAGALINKPFEETTREDWKLMIEVNVTGAAEMVKNCLPFLRKSEKSHVVNIGSMGGFQGSVKFAGLTAYSASKAAIACLSECLATELADDRISVNCLCLGAVNTEMLAKAFPGYEAPLNQGEMAEFIAHFATTAHRFINGQVIPVTFSNP
ncbi:MAG: SDR family oxidoreductase [Saprospirales bacterium]|nr:MAG: SDR family oxidoreductase [Saprospirales bacterium]